MIWKGKKLKQNMIYGTLRCLTGALMNIYHMQFWGAEKFWEIGKLRKKVTLKQIWVARRFENIWKSMKNMTFEKIGRTFEVIVRFGLIGLRKRLF